MASEKDQNKALVLQMYDEVWNKGNMDFANAAFSAQFKDHAAMRAQELPDRGRDAIIEAVNNFRQAMPDFHTQMVKVVAEDDRVMYVGRMTGTHSGKYLQVPPSGNKVEVLRIDDYRVENGKIVERWSMFNLMALMQQMGAVPAQPGGH